VATQDDVRRIALSLPGAQESPEGFAFTVPHKGRPKGFVWAWRERVHPRKPRIPSSAVVAVRVADLSEKGFVLAMDERKFFTEPHYDGYPAVLVRLAEVSADELEQLIVSSWRCLAPRELAAALDGEGGRRRERTHDGR